MSTKSSYSADHCKKCIDMNLKALDAWRQWWGGCVYTSVCVGGGSYMANRCIHFSYSF